MTTPSRLILIFAIAFAILLIAPPFLSQQFSPYPLMKTGDVFDILTPVILIPLYWLLFRLGKAPSTREIALFLVFTALWIEGQGMHLGANSIKHLMDDLHGTDVYALTDFYDEVLGHYLWHIGVAGLALLLVWRQIGSPLEQALASLRTEIAAAVIYGFVYCLITIEAGTVPLGLPVAVIVTLIGLTRRRDLRREPLTAFFFAAHALALILLAIWVARWGGFPQFSELGWL